MSARIIEAEMLQKLTKNALQQISGLDFILLGTKAVEERVQQQVEQLSDEDFENLGLELQDDEEQ
jgi:hypothetical protein